VVYTRDANDNPQLLPELTSTFAKEGIQNIHFLGDTDTATNFEFARQAAFLASAANPAKVMLPRIPMDRPKGIDDCREALGEQFEEFFHGVIQTAIPLDRKIDPSSVAFLILEREVDNIKALKGPERERYFKRIVSVIATAQRVGETDATARLRKLGAKIIGVTVTELKTAIRTEYEKHRAHANEQQKTKAAEPDQKDTLFKQLVSEFGFPAYLDGKGQPSKINERFFAELIARENQIVHDADDQRFYVYNPKNGCWERRTAHSLKTQLSCRIRQGEREWEYCDNLSKLDTEPNRRDVISLLRGVVEKIDFFVNRPHAIHAANCMLVFEDGKVVEKPFAPLFRSRNQLAVVYDQKAKCPRFINDLLIHALRQKSEPELQASHAGDLAAIMKMFGLLVLGRNRPQRIFVLTGHGNTGKTTVCLIAKGLVGERNCAELRTNQLEGRFEMARLLDKTLVFGADVAANFLMTESADRLKSIVGGDPLVGERKNSNEDFRFKGDINALITANVRLLIKMHGDFDRSAWGRRLFLINFVGDPVKNRIVNFDQILLKEEGSGILNFAIDGLLAYYKDEATTGDIAMNDEQRQRVEKLLSESDGLRTFITTELVEEDGTDVTTDEIVVAYAKYARKKKWRVQRKRTIENQAQDLILEAWGVTQSHDIKR
jgi:phage/plasmid-associated DNA primase